MPITPAQVERVFRESGALREGHFEFPTGHMEDPEYLYYTLGKLEIFKLREDYRKQEGSKFTLQKFHDEFLRHGAPPIPLLREVMLKDRSVSPMACMMAISYPRWT